MFREWDYDTPCPMPDAKLKPGESYCMEASPRRKDGVWVCTRVKGHQGDHRAGVDNNKHMLAMWDDECV